MFILVFVFLWFGKAKYTVIMGDDIIWLYNLIEKQTFLELIFNFDQLAGKYRPIFFIFIYLPVKIFKLSYNYYFNFNKLVFSITIFSIYCIVSRITNKKYLGIVVCILCITTPFNAYFIGQVYGLMECLSVIFINIIFYLILIKYQERPKSHYIYYVSFLFFLLIFTAERYMCILPAIYISILISKTKKYTKIKNCFVVSIPIIIRFALSKIFLGFDMFATGRGNVFELMNNFIAFTYKEIVNILGFAIGDQWHGGFLIQDIPTLVLLINTLFIIVLFINIYFCADHVKNFLSSAKNRTNYMDLISSFLIQYKQIIITLAFFVANLVPYALVAKTHGEDRFMFAPYLFLLIFLALTFNYLSFIKIKKSLLPIMILCIILKIIPDAYYKSVKLHVNWKYSLEMAQTCYDDIKQKNLDLANKNIYFVNCSPDCVWIFADQDFMKLYFNNSINTYYVDTLNDIPIDANDENSIFIVPETNIVVPYPLKSVSYREIL